MPVSYLHPIVKEGALLREPFSRLVCRDFGESFLVIFTGDGERAPKEPFRACGNGVEGTEWELRGDRWGRTGGIELRCSAKVVRSSLVGILGSTQLVIGKEPDTVW